MQKHKEVARKGNDDVRERMKHNLLLPAKRTRFDRREGGSLMGDLEMRAGVDSTRKWQKNNCELGGDLGKNQKSRKLGDKDVGGASLQKQTQKLSVEGEVAPKSRHGWRKQLR